MLIAWGAWADAPTLGVEGIKPGMKGYGLTVFRGETPERFDVEVIDVLHNFRPDQDLVLVRTLHPILEKAITVAGMSGSPIYLNDKLIGAYAYGWTFGKEPIAGVTPIKNMLAEINRPLDPKIWKSLGTMPALLDGNASKKVAQLDDARGRAERFGALREAGAFSELRAQATRLGLPQPSGGATRSVLAPAATPLLVSGMTDGALEVLGRELERFGIVPMQAGGGAAKPSAAKVTTGQEHFVDGGSIGVQMMRGDINATAIGTVTHVMGDRLVAFGHPMLNAGQVGLPTCTSRVVHILSSEMRSFKIAEAISPLGTLIHDRQAAIVIDQKLKADMVPLHVHVSGVPTAQRTDWNLEIANHRMLTPSLTFGATTSVLGAIAADSADAVFRVKSKVAIDGHGTIETEDLGFSPGGGADPGIMMRARLFSVLGAVYGNPFEDARVGRIDLEIELRFERDVVSIVDALVQAEEVDPGKDVNVYVTLRRFDQREEVKIIPVAIPMSAAGETVEIAIEAGDAVQIEEPKATSLDDILADVSHGYPASSLVVSTKLPSQGVRLRGQIVNALPGSALDTLQPTNESDRGQTFPTMQRKELPLGRIVTGSAKIKVNVRQEPLR